MEIIPMDPAMEEQESGTVIKRLSVPIGLEELMSGLSKEVLHKQPQDMYTFASEYFARLLALRDESSQIQRFVSSKFAHCTDLPNENKKISRQLSVCDNYSAKSNKDKKRPPLTNKTNLQTLKQTPKTVITGELKNEKKKKIAATVPTVEESATLIENEQEISPCAIERLTSSVETSENAVLSASSENVELNTQENENVKNSTDAEKTETDENDGTNNNETDKKKSPEPMATSALVEMHGLQHSSELHDASIIQEVNKNAEEVKKPPKLSDSAAATAIQSCWRGYSTRKTQKINHGPSSSSTVDNLDNIKGDKTLLPLVRSISVTDSVISKTVGDDEEKLHSIEDTGSTQEHSEDLGIDSDKNLTCMKEKTNSLLSDEECEPFDDEKLSTVDPKHEDTKNLKYTSEMHDDLVIIPTPNTEENDILEHSSETHDTLIPTIIAETSHTPDKDSPSTSKALSDQENFENVQNSGPSEGTRTSELHDTNVIKEESKLLGTSSNAPVTENESNLSLNDKDVSDKQSVDLTHSGEMHDSILLNKEDIQEQNEHETKNNKSNLAHTGEMHDVLITKEESTKTESGNEILAKESTVSLTNEPNINNQDLIHSSEMHDTIVNNVESQMVSPSQSESNNLYHSSELHDMVLLEPESKLTGTPILAKSDVGEEVKSETEHLNHSSEMHDIVVSDQSINALEEPKLLVHSSEMHDIAGTELSIPNESLVSTSDIHNAIAGTEVSEKTAIEDTVTTQVVNALESSQVDGQNKDIIAFPDKESSNENFFEEPTSNDHTSLSHSSEMHDVIETPAIEDVSPITHDNLEHSSEIHDTVVNTENGKSENKDSAVESSIKLDEQIHTSIPVNQEESLDVNDLENQKPLTTDEQSVDEDKASMDNSKLEDFEVKKSNEQEFQKSSDTEDDKTVNTSDKVLQLEMINDESIPKAAASLSHSSEMHDTIVEEVQAEDKNIDIKCNIVKETSGLDSATITKEEKHVEIPEIEQTTQKFSNDETGSKESVYLNHRSEIHDAIETSAIKDVSLNANDNLLHSSEMHDTTIVVEETSNEKMAGGEVNIEDKVNLKEFTNLETRKIDDKKEEQITSSPNKEDTLISNSSIIEEAPITNENISLLENNNNELLITEGNVDLSHSDKSDTSKPKGGSSNEADNLLHSSEMHDTTIIMKEETIENKNIDSKIEDNANAKECSNPEREEQENIVDQHETLKSEDISLTIDQKINDDKLVSEDNLDFSDDAIGTSSFKDSSNSNENLPHNSEMHDTPANLNEDKNLDENINNEDKVIIKELTNLEAPQITSVNQEEPLKEESLTTSLEISTDKNSDNTEGISHSSEMHDSIILPNELMSHLDESTENLLNTGFLGTLHHSSEMHDTSIIDDNVKKTENVDSNVNLEHNNLPDHSKASLSNPLPSEDTINSTTEIQPKLEEARKLARSLLENSKSPVNDDKIGQSISPTLGTLNNQESLKESTDPTHFDVSKLHLEVLQATEENQTLTTNEPSKENYIEKEDLTNINYDPNQLKLELKEAEKDFSQEFDQSGNNQNYQQNDNENIVVNINFDSSQLSKELKEIEHSGASFESQLLNENSTKEDPDAANITNYDSSKLHSEIFTVADLSSKDEQQEVTVQEESVLREYDPKILTKELEDVVKTAPTEFQSSSPSHSKIVQEVSTVTQYDSSKLHSELANVSQDIENSSNENIKPDSILEEPTNTNYDPSQLTSELKEVEKHLQATFSEYPSDKDSAKEDPDANNITNFDAFKLHSEVTDASKQNLDLVSDVSKCTDKATDEHLVNNTYDPTQLRTELENVENKLQREFESPRDSDITNKYIEKREETLIYDPSQLNMEINEAVKNFEESFSSENQQNGNETTTTALDFQNNEKSTPMEKTAEQLSPDTTQLNQEPSSKIDQNESSFSIPTNSNTSTQYHPEELHLQLKKVSEESENTESDENKTITVMQEVSENINYDPSQLNMEISEAAQNYQQSFESLANTISNPDPDATTTTEFDSSKLRSEVKEASEGYSINEPEEVKSVTVVEEVKQVNYDPSNLKYELSEAVQNSQQEFELSSQQNQNICDPDASATVRYDPTKLSDEIAKSVQCSPSDDEEKNKNVTEEKIPKALFDSSQLKKELKEAELISPSTDEDDTSERKNNAVVEQSTNINYDSSQLKMELKEVENNSEVSFDQNHENLPNVSGKLEDENSVNVNYNASALRSEVLKAADEIGNFTNEHEKKLDEIEPDDKTSVIYNATELSKELKKVEEDAQAVFDSESSDSTQSHFSVIEEASNSYDPSQLKKELQEVHSFKSDDSFAESSPPQEKLSPSQYDPSKLRSELEKASCTSNDNLDISQTRTENNNEELVTIANSDNEDEDQVLSSTFFNKDSDNSKADLQNLSPKFSRSRNASLTEKSLGLVLDQQLALTAPSVLKKDTEGESPEYIYIPLKDSPSAQKSESESTVPESTPDTDVNKPLNEKQESVAGNSEFISPRTASKNEDNVEKVLGSITDQQLAITVPNMTVEKIKPNDGSDEPKYIYIPLKDPNGADECDNESIKESTENPIAICSADTTQSSKELNNNIDSYKTGSMETSRVDDNTSKLSNLPDEYESGKDSVLSVQSDILDSNKNGLKGNQLYTYEYQQADHTDEESNHKMELATIIQTTQIADDGLPLAVQLSQGPGQVFIIIDCSQK